MECTYCCRNRIDDNWKRISQIKANEIGKCQAKRRNFSSSSVDYELESHALNESDGDATRDSGEPKLDADVLAWSRKSAWCTQRFMTLPWPLSFSSMPARNKKLTIIKLGSQSAGNRFAERYLRLIDGSRVIYPQTNWGLFWQWPPATERCGKRSVRSWCDHSNYLPTRPLELEPHRTSVGHARSGRSSGRGNKQAHHPAEQKINNNRAHYVTDTHKLRTPIGDLKTHRFNNDGTDSIVAQCSIENLQYLQYMTRAVP